MSNQKVYKRAYKPETNSIGLLNKAIIPVFLIVVAIFSVLLITYSRGGVETVKADNTQTEDYDFNNYTITTDAEHLNRIEESNYRFNSSTKLTDKRGYLFDMYFKDNNSPLLGTGDLFAAACDAYGAPRECITVLAIAKHETDLCKYRNSFEMNNCWGWGGGGEHRQTFKDIGEGIWTVTRVLVQQYGQRYMEDPRLMEVIFCGDDPTCPNWGSRILSIMYDIRAYAKNKGIALE